MEVRRDRVAYDIWVRDGFIEATNGNVIDYDIIRKRIAEPGQRFAIREIAYDRWGRDPALDAAPRGL